MTTDASTTETSPSTTSALTRLGRAAHRVAGSRVVLGLGVVVSLLVPALTLPRLPHVSPGPVLVGLLPWLLGKYVLCALRWRALTPGHRTVRWHLRAHAESELLGLLTPGHVGADVWRVRRLGRAGVPRGDALLGVAADRVVGAVGMAVFVAFAGASLPVRTLVPALALTAVAAAAVLVVRRTRPDLLPSRPLPRPPVLLQALALSAAYQLTIAALLVGTVSATGHAISPVAALGAFGASQLAGVVPGPNGASPRDGALVLALVAAGVPLLAAVAAVSLKAALAWLPALVLGGGCLLLGRRAALRTGPVPALT